MPSTGQAAQTHHPPPAPPAGMCPPGWDGSFVCEPDKHKALDMYKAYREGRKYEEPAAGAAAHH